MVAEQRGPKGLSLFAVYKQASDPFLNKGSRTNIRNEDDPTVRCAYCENEAVAHFAIDGTSLEPVFVCGIHLIDKEKTAQEFAASYNVRLLLKEMTIES